MIFLELDDLLTRQSFQSLFQMEDYIDELELSTIHQAVLGLRHRELSEELKRSQIHEIDDLDRRNRSALSWAALRGDCEAVRLLVGAGADKNLADCKGNTPLIHSLQSRSKDTSCMVGLLQAGANAMVKNYMGRDALWCAVESLAPVDCIKPLITAGIDIATKHSNGSSLLSRAVKHNDGSWVSALLKSGADIEAADSDGNTALIESLLFRSDDALKLLLERGADYTKTDSYGGSILHNVAIYGGLRTIEIVRAAEFKGIDLHTANRQGKTALEMVRNRQAKPDGFEEAFESLLAGIRAQGQLSQREEYGDGDSLDQSPGSRGQEPGDVWSDALEVQTP